MAATPKHSVSVAGIVVRDDGRVLVTVEQLTGVYKNLTHGIVALVFRCRVAGGEPHPTEEAREIRWITKEEVQSYMAPAFGIRVLDAFEKAPQSRAHDGVHLVVQ